MLNFFSPDYGTARKRFLDLARARGASIESLPLQTKGPCGEDLATDIAWIGAGKPKRMILHSSGLHGVEGFAGSAIQLSLLEKPPALPPDAALVFAHVLNPYGMAWLRRVNENNVDLNRNCLPDGEYSGAPAGYCELNSLLNPQSPPSFDFYLLRAALHVVGHGWSTVKQSVAGGQYEFPKGLFFGGREKQREIAGYENFLRGRLAPVERLIGIDVHTGIGPYGKDTLLVQTEEFATMRRTFGERVRPLRPDQGPAYRVTGGIESMILNLLARPKACLIGQEFGTFGPIRILAALRDENRWHYHGTGSVSHPAKQRLRDVFFPQDESWQAAVLGRGRALLTDALRELSC